MHSLATSSNDSATPLPHVAKHVMFICKAYNIIFKACSMLGFYYSMHACAARGNAIGCPSIGIQSSVQLTSHHTIHHTILSYKQSPVQLWPCGQSSMAHGSMHSHIRVNFLGFLPSLPLTTIIVWFNIPYGSISVLPTSQQCPHMSETTLTMTFADHVSLRGLTFSF